MGMSRWVGLLCFLYSTEWLFSLEFFVSAVDDAVSSNHLRVSIRNHLLQDVPSCQHRIAQVELLNLHPTDVIEVRSIRTTIEHTEVLIGDEILSGEGDMQGLPDVPTRSRTDLPQQFHVSKLPEVLRIGPGQVVYVPIAFLPRFPLPDGPPSVLFSMGGIDTNDDEVQYADFDSLFQEVDWLDIIHTDAAHASRHPRNTLHRKNFYPESPQEDSRFQVTSTILVVTDQGHVELPIEATASRENPYGLPDVIYFDTEENEDDILSQMDEAGQSPEDRKIQQALQLMQEIKEKERLERESKENKNKIQPDGKEGNGENFRTDKGQSESSKTTTSGLTKAGVTIVDSIEAGLVMDESNIDPMVIQDCFDLFMTNPGVTAELRVTEVLLTRRENVSLYLFPEKGKKGSDSVAASLTPRQMINQWHEDSPADMLFEDDFEDALRIPADGEVYYVVTICAAKEADIISSARGKLKREATCPENDTDKYLSEAAEWIDNKDNFESLGFVQIRTNQDTFFIGLQRANDQMRHDFRSMSKTVKEMLAKQKTAATKNRPETFKLIMPPKFHNLVSRGLVSTEPEKIDFRILSTASRQSEIQLDIDNRSRLPIRIMRLSIALESFQTNFLRDEGNQTSRTLEELGIVLSLNEVDSSDSHLIVSERSKTSVVSLLCEVDWEKFTNSTPEISSVKARGSLLIRGTTKINLAFAEWRRSLKDRPSTESDVVLEIPLSVEVAAGGVSFHVEGSTKIRGASWKTEEVSVGEDTVAVSGGFFVSDRNLLTSAILNSEATDMSFEADVGFRFRLRLLTNLNIGMRVRKAEIISDTGAISSAERSFCGRFNVETVKARWNEYFDALNLSGIGIISLSYNFGDENDSIDRQSFDDILPATCLLRVQTKPFSGFHDLPLLVYSGRLQIAGAEKPFGPGGILGNNANYYETSNVNPGQVVAGMEDIVDWFQDTKAGFALKSLLKSSSESGSSRDIAVFKRYMYNLLPVKQRVENTHLNPILLKAGAIEQGGIESFPLFFTNYNPVPVTVMIEVGEVEGMSIVVNRDQVSEKGDGNTILDYLPSSVADCDRRVASGPFKGHPVEGLRRFLLTDNSSTNYLNDFYYRDDVSLSRAATVDFPILKKLFKSYLVGKFHKTMDPRWLIQGGSGKCSGMVHPPHFGTFGKKLSTTGRKLPGAIIISSDRKLVRQLPICTDSWVQRNDTEDGRNLVIPPGGVARFDLRVRCPASSVLEKDITQFLATGLILSTSYGELVPILVALDALQGKFEVSHIPSIMQPGLLSSKASEGEVNVPAGLFGSASDMDDSSIRIPPHDERSFLFFRRGETIVPRNASSGLSSISLFMKSSFLRDVRLLKVMSCNPWFEVNLVDETREADSDPFLGVEIGSVSSIIPCDPIHGVPQNETIFPSFFRCALDWLTQRTDLQPKGCGMSPNQNEKRDFWDPSHGLERGGIERTIKALKKALVAAEWSDEILSDNSSELRDPRGLRSAFKTGRRGKDGVVSSLVVEAISSAWNEIRKAKADGLFLLGTSLRALVEYNSTPAEVSPVSHTKPGREDHSHLLSLPIRNVTVKTSLDMPVLLNHPKIAETSNLGEDRCTDCPQVVEFPPTFVSEVVLQDLHLRNPTSAPIRVRLAVSPTNLSKDDTASSQFLGNYRSPYVQNRRVASVVPKDYADHQWWDRDGAFFHNDIHGDWIRSHFNITIKSVAGARVSLLNPSVFANSAFLVGCGTRCGLRNENKNQKAFEPLVNLVPTSPIGASSAANTYLVGRHRSFDSQGELVTSSGLGLEAGGSLIAGGTGPAAFAVPYSALDEIVLPPFSDAVIGPVLFRPPGRRQMLGCAAVDGNAFEEDCKSQFFESLIFLENSLTGLERVVLRGKALWESIVFLDRNPDDFGDLEVRNGRTTLLFSGTPEWTSKAQKLPERREFLIHNDGDVTILVTRIYFSSMSNAQESRLCELEYFSILGCNEMSAEGPIILLPGKNKSVVVMHFPQCSKRKNYVSLRVDWEVEKESYQEGSEGFSRSSLIFKKRYLSTSTFPRKRTSELIVGYEMSSADLAACTHVEYPEEIASDEKDLIWIELPLLSRNETNRGLAVSKSQAEFLWSYFVLACTASALTVLAVALKEIRSRYLYSKSSSHTFRRCLGRSVGRVSSSEKVPRAGKNWPAAFRCLARVDPTSSDLQGLSREQTRQIVLARLANVGALPPQCYNRQGVANRERRGPSATAAARQATVVPGKQPFSAPTNERVRMSDAIFASYKPLFPSNGYLPAQLGWRVAVSRGLINGLSIQTSAVKLRTADLQRRRGDRHFLDTDHTSEEEEEEEKEDNTEEKSYHDNASFSVQESAPDDFSEDEDDDTSTPVSVPENIPSETIHSHQQTENNEGAEIQIHAKEAVVETEKKVSAIAFKDIAESKSAAHAEKEISKTSKLLDSPKPITNEKFTVSAPIKRFAKTKNDSSSERGEMPNPKVPKAAMSSQQATTQQSKAKQTSPRQMSKNTDTEKAKTDSKTEISEDKKTGKRRKQSGRNSKTSQTKSPASDKTPRPSVSSPVSQKKNARKVSSVTSSATTTPNRAPQIGQTIRPPPGLQPPPGFGNQASTAFRLSSLPTQGSLLSPDPLGSAISTDSAMSAPSVTANPLIVTTATLSGGSNNISESTNSFVQESNMLTSPGTPSSTGRGFSPQPVLPEEPTLNLGPSVLRDDIIPSNDKTSSDFDIMDFLDNILEEETTTVKDGNLDMNVGGFLSNPAPATAPPAPSMIPTTSTTASSLPLNPWATTTTTPPDDTTQQQVKQSRAAAYGIAFEESSEREVLDGNDENNDGDVPLFNPSAILASKSLDDNSTDEPNVDINSFYANLLNETLMDDF